jgi:hypothetical protein
MKQIEVFQDIPKNPEHRHHIRISKTFDHINYQCGCGRYFSKEQFMFYFKNHLFDGVSDKDLEGRKE